MWKKEEALNEDFYAPGRGITSERAFVGKELALRHRRGDA